MEENNQGINFLKDKDWSLIDGELCKAYGFSPLIGSKVKEGVVISSSTNVPYASIKLKCKKIEKEITGFVTHKIDFTNLWEAFNNRGINEEEEEVLLYWTAKHYNYKLIQLLSNLFIATTGATPFPKLIVMICPKGTYKSIDSFNLTAEDKVRVFVYGLMSIKYWVPDVIK